MRSELSFKKASKNFFCCCKKILFSLRGKKEGLEKDFPRRGNLFLLKRHMIFKIKNEISLSGGKKLWAQAFFKNNFPKNFFSKTKLFLKSFDFHLQNLFSGENQNLEKRFSAAICGVFVVPLSQDLFLRTGKQISGKGTAKKLFSMPKFGEEKTFPPQRKNLPRRFFHTTQRNFMNSTEMPNIVSSSHFRTFPIKLAFCPIFFPSFLWFMSSAMISS